MQAFAVYYNWHRPHQGLGNRVLGQQACLNGSWLKIAGHLFRLAVGASSVVYSRATIDGLFEPSANPLGSSHANELAGLSSLLAVPVNVASLPFESSTRSVISCGN